MEVSQVLAQLPQLEAMCHQLYNSQVGIGEAKTSIGCRLSQKWISSAWRRTAKLCSGGRKHEI